MFFLDAYWIKNQFTTERRVTVGMTAFLMEILAVIAFFVFYGWLIADRQWCCIDTKKFRSRDDTGQTKARLWRWNQKRKEYPRKLP